MMRLREKPTGFYVDGANQIGPFRLKGAGALHLCDGISFAGVESINPKTGKPTGHLLIVAVSEINGTEITTSPPLVTYGSWRNASGLPANGAMVTSGLEEYEEGEPQ